MVNYYPIMLNLTGKKVVVVGGGTVAARKIRTLLEANADVTVVSPQLHEDIAEAYHKDHLTWKKKNFEPEDLTDAFIVIAATNHSEVNFQVYESTDDRQLINVVDKPELSTFIVPASIRKGKLTIAVSTSGAMPGLSRKIKQDLELQYDDKYEEYLDFLEQSRQKVLHEITDINIRKQILQKLLQPPFLELTKQGQYAEREAAFLELWKKGSAT